MGVAQQILAAGRIALPPDYVGMGAPANSASTSISPGLPSGWQPGDYHLLAILTRKTSSYVSAASVTGFTTLGTDTDVNWISDYYRASLRARVAQAGDTAPSISASGEQVGAVIFGFRNVSSSTTPSSAVNATDVSTYSYDGASSGGDNRLALQFFYTRRASTGTPSDTPQSGWTWVSSMTLSSMDGSPEIGLDYKLMSTAGNASGTHTFSPGTYRIMRKGLFLLPF